MHTLLLTFACAAPAPPQPAAPPPPPAANEVALPPQPPPWPMFGATLRPPAAPAPELARRVYLDAGHGAPGNPGNTGVRCVSEQDFTVQITDGLAAHLGGLFSVRTSRTGEARPGYKARMADAASWGAEAFISVHSDVRSGATTWRPDPEAPDLCPLHVGAVGFTVLWSDEGAPERVGARLALARALAARLIEAGFPAYDGADYEGLYEVDPEHPGVFVDRHIPRKRILFLRRPQMPSVIVETHHAWDPDEVARWEEPATRAAFNAAIAAGLGDWFARE